MVVEGVTFPPLGAGFAVLLGAVVLSAVVITSLAVPLMDAATRYDAIRYERALGSVR